VKKPIDFTNEQLIHIVDSLTRSAEVRELLRRFEELLDDDRYENADHHKLVGAGLESPSPLTVALAKRLDEALTLIGQRVGADACLFDYGEGLDAATDARSWLKEGRA